MRNSVDITRGYQIAYMLKKTLFAAFLCILVEIVVFINYLDVEVMRRIVCIIMVLTYGMILYNGAATLGKFDAKPYTPLKPNLKVPFLWGGTIALISVIFLVIYKINWTMLQGAEIPSMVSVVINAIFYFWNSPYLPYFIGDNSGSIETFIMVYMLVYPFVICFIGYLAGTKGFSIVDKITLFTFEKPDSEE